MTTTADYEDRGGRIVAKSLSNEVIHEHLRFHPLVLIQKVKDTQARLEIFKLHF